MRLGFGARLAIAFASLAMVTAVVMAAAASASANRSVRNDLDDFLRDRSADIAEGRRSRPPRFRDDDRTRDDRSTRESDGSEDDNESQDDDGQGDDETGEGDEAAESVLRAVEADAIVQVLDVNGDLVVSTGVLLPVTEADISFADDFSPVLLRSEVIDGETYRMITQHIGGGGVVQVAHSLEGTNVLLGRIRRELFVLGLGMSGLAGLVGWGIASGTTRPLRRLTRTLESIRETGDLSRPVALERDDEIGRLSESFDDLLATLDASRSQQHQLVQDAAHELRTPLTSVRANIAFLERADDLDADERASTLRSIKAELAELSDLLGEVVELATESRDDASFQRIDLVTVAEAALAQFELRSGRPIERQMEPTLVIGDATMLTRAVANLIGNADKYTPEEAAPVRVKVASGTVTVADRGPGVKPGDHDRLFERFWRADGARSAPGSGLGLAIVKKVIDEHGGSVYSRDRPGGGLEIGFRIPEAAHR